MVWLDGEAVKRGEQRYYKGMRCGIYHSDWSAHWTRFTQLFRYDVPEIHRFALWQLRLLGEGFRWGKNLEGVYLFHGCKKTLQPAKPDFNSSGSVQIARYAADSLENLKERRPRRHPLLTSWSQNCVSMVTVTCSNDLYNSTPLIRNGKTELTVISKMKHKVSSSESIRKGLNKVLSQRISSQGTKIGNCVDSVK